MLGVKRILLGCGLGLLLSCSSEEPKMNVGEIAKETDSLYTALQSELAFYREKADSLYPALLDKEAELDKQYLKIKNLLAQADQQKDNARKLASQVEALQEELKKLRAFVDEQTLDLAELRRQNAQLVEERSEYRKLYEQEQDLKDSLAQKAANLKATTEELNKQLDKGAILRISNLEFIAAKLTRGGETKATNRRKRAEFFQACFKMVKNEVVQPGPNKFYMQIIDPNGHIIVEEKMGGGYFSDADGNKLPYTIVKSFEYYPDKEELCLSWSPAVGSKWTFEKGEYSLQLYNRGLKVGFQKLSLR